MKRVSIGPLTVKLMNPFVCEIKVHQLTINVGYSPRSYCSLLSTIEKYFISLPIWS